MKKDLVVLNIKHPDEALFSDSEALLEIARLREITTPEMAIAAGEDLKDIKRLAKQVNEKRLAITRPLNDALKEVNALFKPAKAFLSEAEALLKSKILEFQNEQERIARIAQAKADAEVRKEREKLERRAAKAEAKGKEDKAEELREQAETQIAPIVTSAAPKLAGISRRETWKAEVTDKRLFLKYIVDEHIGLLGIVHISQSALNNLARLRKDDLNMPGIKAVKEASIAARRH